MPSDHSEHYWSYLKEEYSRIAEAHFNTNTTISLFFRYYLIIITAPIGIIGLVISLKPQGGMTLAGAVRLVYTINLPLIIIFMCAAFIGGLVLWYIINLRSDAILYARTVNSIRKLFRNESGMTLEERVRISVLPESPHQPPYLEKSFFLPVVFSFATLNSLYVLFALVVYRFSFVEHLDSSKITNVYVKDLLILPFWAWSFIVLIFMMHLVLYWVLTRHREYSYLRSHSIGVDIDGVLNDHRSQFVKFLKQQSNRVIDKDQITVIPVHEDERLGVTREEERKVFDAAEYWLGLPPTSDAAAVLQRMTNGYRLQIFIFTYRPWPDSKDKELLRRWREAIKEHWKDNAARNKEGIHTWLQALANYWKVTRSPVGLIGWVPFRFRSPIRTITRMWLSENRFKFKKLYIEKGNDNTTDARVKIKNRFNLARKKNLRFFAEDDLAKALKLSYFCEVVFLIDQPYNHTANDLPPNVVRVKSLEDLYRRMRELV